MSVFQTRVPTGTLMVAAVAAMLALPFFFASGEQPSVGLLAPRDALEDLRIDAPDWIFDRAEPSGARVGVPDEQPRSVLLELQDQPRPGSAEALATRRAHHAGEPAAVTPTRRG